MVWYFYCECTFGLGYLCFDKSLGLAVYSRSSSNFKKLSLIKDSIFNRWELKRRWLLKIEMIYRLSNFIFLFNLYFKY
jgi:hypothetical protein